MQTTENVQTSTEPVQENQETDKELVNSVSASMEDIATIIKVRKILAKGFSTELKLCSDGKLKIYQIKKTIV